MKGLNTVGTPEYLLQLMADYNLLDAMAAMHNTDPVSLEIIIRKYANPSLLENLTFEALGLAGLQQIGKKY